MKKNRIMHKTNPHPLLAILVSAPGRRQNWFLVVYVLVMELFAAVMMMDYLPGTSLFVGENLCRDVMLIALMAVMMLYLCGRDVLFTRYDRKDNDVGGSV